MAASVKGFTLLELLVVMSLISLMLFMTIPQFTNNPFVDQKRKASAWIIGTVQNLKHTATRDRLDHTLHIEIDSGRLWVSNESMTDEELTEAEEKAYALPDALRIKDIEFPIRETIALGRADIRFFKKGYSDMAVIHAELSDDTVTSFFIEPFLPGVKRYEKSIGFNQ